MKTPNLSALIEAHLTTDQAHDFFGFNGAVLKYRNKILPGIEAAQKVLDHEWPAIMTEAAPVTKEEETKAGLREMALPPIKSARAEEVDLAEVSAPDGFAEIIAKLRPRVRVPEGSSDMEVLEAVIAGKWSRKVAMIVPLDRPINRETHYGHMALLRKTPWMGYDQVSHSVLQRARNLVVAQFLKTEAEWCLMVDGDNILPFGDPARFYDKLGFNEHRCPPRWLQINAVERLMESAHKSKATIIGGIYRERRPRGKLVIQPALHPRNDEDKQIVAAIEQRGPMDKVVQVGYCATGCMLVHRKVFADIAEKFPERAAKVVPLDVFDFFGHDVGLGGEDIAFCQMAEKAGHPSFLDLGVWCGHVGEFCYSP